MTHHLNVGWEVGGQEEVLKLYGRGLVGQIILASLGPIITSLSFGVASRRGNALIGSSKIGKGGRHEDLLDGSEPCELTVDAGAVLDELSLLC